MRVRAIKLGFYDNKRCREGQEFVLKSKDHFSAKWMLPLDQAEQIEPLMEEKPKAKKKAKKADKPAEVEENDSDQDVI